MSKAEQIRRLYQEGRTVSEVAKALGIRYQQAYNVLKQAGLLKTKQEEPTPRRTGVYRWARALRGYPRGAVRKARAQP